MKSNRRLGAILVVSATLLALAFFLYPRLREARDQALFEKYAEPPFPSPGAVLLPRVSAVTALALQPDHKILLAGPAGDDELSDFAVLRLLPDGSRDAAFGQDGMARADFGADERPFGLTVQEDGSIVVAGECRQADSTAHPCAARFTSAGGLADKLILAPSDKGGARAVAVSNGGLWIAGSLEREKRTRFALWRLSAGGKLEGSFELEFAKADAQAVTLAVLPDSKVLMGGTVREGQTLSFALARFLADGRPDDGFGEGGKTKGSFLSASNYLYAMLPGPNGGTLVAGSSGVLANYDAALARFGADGKPDATFGFNGVTIAPVGNRDDMLHGLHRLPSGKLLAVGSAEIDSLSVAVFLARFHPDGKLDNGFGTEGTRAEFSEHLTVSASALQPNGKVLVAGGRIDGKTGDFGGYVARFTADGAMDRK